MASSQGEKTGQMEALHMTILPPALPSSHTAKRNKTETATGPKGDIQKHGENVTYQKPSVSVF